MSVVPPVDGKIMSVALSSSVAWASIAVCMLLDVFTESEVIKVALKAIKISVVTEIITP